MTVIDRGSIVRGASLSGRFRIRQRLNDVSPLCIGCLQSARLDIALFKLGGVGVLKTIHSNQRTIFSGSKFSRIACRINRVIRASPSGRFACWVTCSTCAANAWFYMWLNQNVRSWKVCRLGSRNTISATPTQLESLENSVTFEPRVSKVTTLSCRPAFIRSVRRDLVISPGSGHSSRIR